jgi:hypothetical protein
MPDCGSWPALRSDDDRAWFRRYPGRSYRVRQAYPDEAPDHLTGVWVIVRQVTPGLRVRAVVGLDTDARPDENEANARRLFEQAAGIGDARKIIRAVEGLAT